jgi:CBS domain-containing protein
MYEFLDYRVCDAMTAQPTTIPSDTPLARIEEIFDRHQFNALPVVDAEGRLLGVVTKLDALKAFRFTPDHMFPPYEEIMATPASAIMTERVVTVSPRTPLTRVLETLVRTRSKSLPVVEDGKLVGVIAREDVLRSLKRAVAGERATGTI